MQPCYVRTWTSLGLTLDLLGPDPHAKGYHLYTSYNLSDPFFIINESRPPVLVFSPITDLIFKRLHCNTVAVEPLKNQVSDRVHRHVIRVLKLLPTLYS